MSASPVTQQSTHKSPFPIERCLPEIFVSILQAIVDDEASYYSHRHMSCHVKPKTTINLALVSRRWKEMVYATPSLWAVIAVDLDITDLQKLKERFHYLVSKAKEAPVDLYIFGLHVQHDIYSGHAHEPEDCSSSPENVGYFITHTPHIRKLQISGYDFEIFAYIQQMTPSLPERLRELVHFRSGEERLPQIPISNHFGRMSRLVSLWIGYVECVSIPFNTGIPLFPHLKKLTAQCSSDSYCNTPSQMTIVSFLSHTPQLIELDLPLVNIISCTKQTLPAPVILSNLHTLITHNMSILSFIFINGLIKTPSLKTLEVHWWRNEYNPVLRAFFKLNPSIETVLFAVLNTSEYSVALEGLTKLKELHIRGSGSGNYLKSLVTCGDASSSHPGMPVLARTLRKLTLCNRGLPIALLAFEELAECRCIPVDKNGNTAMGCRALEVLEIAPEFPKEEISEIRHSKLLQKAKISSHPRSWRMRWNYRPQ